MSEVIEDLMKPRYKVIADWPGRSNPMGHIYEYGFITGDIVWHQLKDYPHLFKPLEWWEDRKPEEMPKYYKLPGNGKILKTSFRVEKNSGVVMLDFKPTETVPTALMYTLPATETDYLNYINSKP